MGWRRRLVAVAVISFLGLPGVASAADVLFSGKFKAGGAVHFRLIDHGTKIQGWDWLGLPIRCLEGPDTNSSHYRFDIKVRSDGHFSAQNVSDPEGFHTSLSGAITQHSTKASGTFSMTGPEPPDGTHCHGAMTWSTTGEKATLAYRSGSSALSQPGFFEDCPQDHPLVVGGGVRLVGVPADENTGNLLIETSTPVFSSDGSVDSWAGGAFKLGSQPATLTVTAICTNDTGGFETQTKTVPIPTDSHQSQAVLCPQGTHVVSGGASFAGFDHPHFYTGTSRPVDASDQDSIPDNGWTATGINDSSTSNATMTVTAICALDGTYVYPRSDSSMVLAGHVGSAQVACPSKTSVVGGGVDLKGNGPGIIESSAFDTQDSGSAPNNGWRGRTYNAAAKRQSVQVFAICQPN